MAYTEDILPSAVRRKSKRVSRRATRIYSQGGVTREELRAAMRAVKVKHGYKRPVMRQATKRLKRKRLYSP